MFLSREATDKCLVGWRGWTLYRPHWLVTNRTVWEPHERVEAACDAFHDHEAPVPNCSCGIYSFKKPEMIFDGNYHTQSVLGEVWLWGRVIECKDGYRAQFAYPKKLYATQEMLTKAGKGELEYVAFRYGVELEVIPDDHVLVSESEQQKKMREAAEKRAKIEKMLATKALLDQKVADLPSKMIDPRTGKLFANLLEEVEYEAKRLAGGSK